MYNEIITDTFTVQFMGGFPLLDGDGVISYSLQEKHIYSLIFAGKQHRNCYQGSLSVPNMMIQTITSPMLIWASLSWMSMVDQFQ